jgi:putative transposase
MSQGIKEGCYAEERHKPEEIVAKLRQVDVLASQGVPISTLLHVSERRACAALGQHRSTQRKVPRGPEDEERLTADIIELARLYGRYGYRKIAALLRNAGWLVNNKWVERLWRREGLKVPQKQPKRGVCGCMTDLASGCGRNIVITSGPTTLSRIGPMTGGSTGCNVVDEFTHECLMIHINRKLKAVDVIDVLSDLFILRGVPGHIRSDNGPEFVAKAVQEWIAAVGARTAYIAPAVLGRTAISKSSTPGFATSCSTARSSTR